MDKNTKCYYLSLMVNRWLAFRIETLGNLVLLTVAILAVAGKDSLSAGAAGLAITYAMNIGIT